jgi:hypothetical protein
LIVAIKDIALVTPVTRNTQIKTGFLNQVIASAHSGSHDDIINGLCRFNALNYMEEH